MVMAAVAHKLALVAASAYAESSPEDIFFVKKDISPSSPRAPSRSIGRRGHLVLGVGEGVGEGKRSEGPRRAAGPVGRRAARASPPPPPVRARQESGKNKDKEDKDEGGADPKHCKGHIVLDLQASNTATKATEFPIWGKVIDEHNASFCNRGAEGRCFLRISPRVPLPPLANCPPLAAPPPRLRRARARGTCLPLFDPTQAPPKDPLFIDGSQCMNALKFGARAE